MSEPWHDDATRFERERADPRVAAAVAGMVEAGVRLRAALDRATIAAVAIRAAFANIPPEALCEIRNARRWHR